MFAVPSNSFLYSTWIQQALVESFSVMLSCDQGKMWRWTATKYKDMLYVAISRSYKTLRCFRSSQCVLSMSHLARFFFGRWRLVEAFGFPSADMKTRDSKFKAVSCCFKHFHAAWFEMQNPLIIHSNMHVDACCNQSRKLDSWTHCWCTRFCVLTLIWQRPFRGLIVIQIWLTPNTNQRLHNFRNIS